MTASNGGSPPLSGGLPYRLALSGGWIDQPFISRLDPEPPGSMTVLSVEPDFRFMDRAGMATSTRKAAERLWGRSLPPGEPGALVRELYAFENQGRADPSGAQDMVGLCYPGLSRMDFDYRIEAGVFPARVENDSTEETLSWIESVIWIVPVSQRPSGYSPLEDKRLSHEWVRRLGRSGLECWEAIRNRDIAALSDSFNETMAAWKALLPGTLHHSTIDIDLESICEAYRKRYGGALYSGCGGGYLFIASEEAIPGAFRVRARRACHESAEGRGSGANRAIDEGRPSYAGGEKP